MNYFAHAHEFLHNPYFVAGTAIPDLLTVVDRGVRVRSKQAQLFVQDSDPRIASLAAGLIQHFRDDARFHETRAFVETTLEMTAAARNALHEESGLRSYFLGHLLVEVLLDVALFARAPERLETYYEAIQSVDAWLVQTAINRMASRPTDRLQIMVSRFSQERFLWDYVEDAKLMIRLNQVMRRVRLPQLPASFVEILPAARRRIELRKQELLAGIPVRPAQDAP